MPAIPLLKHDITVSAYGDAAAGRPEGRFLLALGDSHYLISAKARALVLALLAAPANAEQLEADYALRSGHHLPAGQLITLALRTLPAALFVGAPDAHRAMPFTVSATLLPAGWVARLTGGLTWLFTPPLALLLLLAFAVLHALALPLAMHQVHAAGSAAEAAALAGLFLLSGLLHELGHTTACRYFKCPHGAIGFGLYFVFPAWYADVSKAWRLAPRQRAVVDLGGVYFEAVLLIFVDAFALATGNPLAFKLVWLITFAMLFTLNPVFKFDGYWLLSDLSGLHNLHQRVRQNVASRLGSIFKAPAPVFANSDTGAGAKAGRWVLSAYTLLSVGYFLYFATFLFNESQTIAATLPGQMSHARHSLGAALAQHDMLAASLALLRGLIALVWPAVVLSASLFFINKLRRALGEGVASVAVARAAARAARAARAVRSASP